MKGQNLVQAQERINLLDGGIPAFGHANVIARGEQVAGIKTDSQPVRAVDPIVNHRQMIEIMPEAAPLAGGIFERDPNGRMLRRVEYFVEPGYNLLQRRGLSLANVRPRMHDKERQTQLRRE